MTEKELLDLKAEELRRRAALWAKLEAILEEVATAIRDGKFTDKGSR